MSLWSVLKLNKTYKQGKTECPQEEKKRRKKKKKLNMSLQPLAVSVMTFG